MDLDKSACDSPEGTPPLMQQLIFSRSERCNFWHSGDISCH